MEFNQSAFGTTDDADLLKDNAYAQSHLARCLERIRVSDRRNLATQARLDAAYNRKRVLVGQRFDEADVVGVTFIKLVQEHGWNVREYGLNAIVIPVTSSRTSYNGSDFTDFYSVRAAIALPTSRVLREEIFVVDSGAIFCYQKGERGHLRIRYLYGRFAYQHPSLHDLDMLLRTLNATIAWMQEKIALMQSVSA